MCEAEIKIVRKNCSIGREDHYDSIKIRPTAAFDLTQ